MKKNIFILLITIILLTRCDKMEDPFFVIEDDIITSIEFPNLDTASVIRKIVIEEFTGHLCTNCPMGHQKLSELLNQYEGILIPVGIHAGALARPSAAGLFTYDFRVDVGEEIYHDFNISSIPKAIVNRTTYSGSWDIGLNEWQPAIAEINTSQIRAAIQIINVPKGETIIETHAKVTMIENYSNPLLISFYLLEDSIVSPQLNMGIIDTNYVHHHVLRSGINGTYGTRLTNDGILLKDSTYLKSYAIDFSGKDWKTDHCSVVVILHDPETREVIQVEVAECID